jgi:hypothetical protein
VELAKLKIAIRQSRVSFNQNAEGPWTSPRSLAMWRPADERNCGRRRHRQSKRCSDTARRHRLMAADPNVLLVATVANGEIETHWLPRKVRNKIVQNEPGTDQVNRESTKGHQRQFRDD